jgi:metallo-beta-lactamase family protein
MPSRSREESVASAKTTETRHSMKIAIVGASGGEVTGSAYYVRTKKAAVLVDCGQFQGGRKSEALNKPPARSRQKVDAVLITHAHLDHTGRLPLMAKQGYRAPIYATEATIELTALILRDSARILAGDVARKNVKLARAGEPPVAPLYTPEDAETAIALMRPVAYQQRIDVAPGIQAIWAEAGHVLGSASIQLIVDDEGRQKRIVFSGDLGPRTAPILKDYEPFREADMVFIESTYGAREHRPFNQTVEEFVSIVKAAVESGGKMLVPTFAVGRAQLITGLLGWMFRTGKVRPFPIFMDSPMAVEATKIYEKHRELYNDDLLEFIRDRPLREDLKLMKLCVSADDSKKINQQEGPCLVMAGAGMCNAGRILHHFKASLWKPETHVLIVGYQARGTLGRLLVDGADKVKIFGEPIAVKANIHTMGGFSAHAGQSDLLTWLQAIMPSQPKVVVTHGEDDSRLGLGAAAGEFVQLAAPSVPAGYLARLLINEVPFPGERGFVSEEDTKPPMLSILWVLHARMNHIPPGYKQEEIAAIRSQNILDVITAKNQCEGFSKDAAGKPVAAPRVEARIQNLLRIANSGGKPGRFANLLNFGQGLASAYLTGGIPGADRFAGLTVVDQVPVTGRAYSWMTGRTTTTRAAISSKFPMPSKACWAATGFSRCERIPNENPDGWAGVGRDGLGAGWRPRRAQEAVAAPAAAAPPADCWSRPYLYEVTRHLYRWYMDEGDVERAPARGIAFWVRRAEVRLDEGDRSVVATILLPLLGIEVKVKKADYAIEELGSRSRAGASGS